jgi:hypothetical protein
MIHSVGEIPITINVVSSNPSQAEKCTRYVIMFVSDLRQVVGFLLLLLFLSPIKLQYR